MPGPNLKVPNGVDGHISTEAMHDVLRNVAEDMTHHAHSEPIMKSLFDRGAAIAHRVLWQRPNCPDTNQTASKCYDAMAAVLPGVKPRIRVAVVYEQ